MNALVRPIEQLSKREFPLPRLVQASADATKVGMSRAAKMFTFLLAVTFVVVRGGRVLWRLLMAHPLLVVRKGPNGERIELHEEYRVLQDRPPLGQLRW